MTEKLLAKLTIFFLLFFVTITGAFAALGDGLTHYYNMDTNDSILHDSYNLINATAVGSVQFTTDGKFGNATSFNNSNEANRYSFPNNIWNGTTGVPYTFNVWIKDKTSSDGYVFSDFTTAGNNRFNAFFMYHNASFEISTCNGAGCNTGEGILAGIPNQYTMLTVVVNSTNTSFYVNGTLDRTFFENITATLTHGDIRLNSRPGSTGLDNNSEEDELGIWNRTLSSAEVTQLYNNGVGLTFTQITTVTIAPILINFTAINLTGSGVLTNFCVSGSGTNTSFTSCTTNGTVYNNLTGTYNYTVNATGFNNQTVSNFAFSANTTIQFNLTETNLAPSINAVTLSATANNQTLIGSANASDGNTGTNLTYFWTLYRNNTLFSTGSNGTFPTNILSNFNNYTLSSVDGTYILQVIAGDGSLNSSALNSSGITVTFPQTFTLRFNATNISDGALSSFCVMANGSNSFTTCTVSGLITTTLVGTYTFIGFNATGFANQTISSFVFDHNQTIQFNFTETNLAPVVNTVTMSASTDNLTLFFSANVSDPNNDPVFFNWVLYKNGTSIDAGSDGGFQANHNTQFRNHTTTGNGTYILQVTGTDGSLFSSAVNSTGVIITVAPAFVPGFTSSFTAFTGFMLFFIIIAFLIYILFQRFASAETLAFVEKMLLIAFVIGIIIVFIIGLL